MFHICFPKTRNHLNIRVSLEWGRSYSIAFYIDNLFIYQVDPLQGKYDSAFRSSLTKKPRYQAKSDSYAG
jgi:hypothetical protein